MSGVNTVYSLQGFERAQAANNKAEKQGAGHSEGF